MIRHGLVTASRAVARTMATVSTRTCTSRAMISTTRAYGATATATTSRVVCARAPGFRRGFGEETHDDFKPEFKDASTGDLKIFDRIDKFVKESPVVLFMKGVPEAPQCGFSNSVCQILEAEGVKYDAHNVLADDELRQGIKEYSDWPTIPQLYVDGEFVGGADVTFEMFKDGSLKKMLDEAGAPRT
eukprot:TRINITY_DN2369_c0_g2_i3.p1 TRINITY_DN2369_c0_g2~~TRINITY_DN2369_c0_g2_i3.p1  ORF type:complete len:187 (+),score=49.08 TRINITY_DN2369_c0_g2_i3:202-762(+)